MLHRDCFTKYVHTKIIKRMESFRVRHSTVGKQRKLLLPLSFGVSSITLLHILSHHLQTQTGRTGRTGFALHVLFVDTSAVEVSCPDSGRLELVRERYPQHTYSVAQLADIFVGENSMSGLEDQLGISPTTNGEVPTPPQEKLEDLIASLPSATSRSDVITILRTRLIVHDAQELGCEAILWGDSTTRLAERTLAETAKGRGFSLAWQVSDGDTPHGVSFHYPVRNLLKKELVTHADMVSPPLTPLIAGSGPTEASVSSKNTTIDDLMKQYFESVEENYPSIVANVVRTSSKLKAPTVRETDTVCEMCRMPVTDGAFGIHGWGGDQVEAPLASEDGATARLCYGCTRSVPLPGVSIP